jgi:hypothetical protein
MLLTRPMRTFLALLVSLAAAQAADLDFRNAKSREVALSQLEQFLREEGHKPRVTVDACLITHRGLHITHKPVNDPAGLDRLVVSFGFAGTGTPTAAKLKAVNQLNDLFNACAILLDENGDVVFRFNLTFSDVLTGREHREFLSHIHEFLGEFLEDPKTKPLRDSIMR